MTTETLSLMGNSLGHPFELTFDVCSERPHVTLSSRSIVKCKRQTVQVKRHDQAI